MTDIKYTDYPAIQGLAKPPKPATPAPLRLQVSLVPASRALKQNSTRINASPFHGVTRFALVHNNDVSETFHNGAGDPLETPNRKVGRYEEREQIDPGKAFAFRPAGEPRICWKVRNTGGFKQVRFQLFAKGKPEPIWSATWESADDLRRLLQNPLTAGTKQSGGKEVPIDWTGSIAWSELVQGVSWEQLKSRGGAYQLRMTVNEGKDAAQMGYPLVAWTYLYVAEGAGEDPTDDAPELDEATAEASRVWLSVRLLYQGMPIEGMAVQFVELGADHQPGKAVGEAQITDDEGIAWLPEPVTLTLYGAQIEGQALAIVGPVDDPDEPFDLPLPIGEALMTVPDTSAATHADDADDELIDDFGEEVELLFVEGQDEPQPRGSFLAVRLQYQGIPIAGLAVQFVALLENGSPGDAVGTAQLTDDEGVAWLPEPVTPSLYGAQIQGQPLVMLGPVEDPDEPFEITLPVGEARVVVLQESDELLADDADDRILI